MYSPTTASLAVILYIKKNISLLLSLLHFLICFRLCSLPCYCFKFTRDNFKLIFPSFAAKPHQ